MRDYPSQRLQAALAELQGLGFHAQGPAACCTSCSMESVPLHSDYAVWSEQAHEVAFDIDVSVLPTYIYHPLHIWAGHRQHPYGLAPFDDPAKAKVACERVIDVLKRHGFDPAWGGAYTDPIVLAATDMDEFRVIENARRTQV